MGMQLLKFEKVSKGDLGLATKNGAVGFGLGFAQKTVEEKGTEIAGIQLGTAMPALEIGLGLAAQFQKNNTLRSIGQSAIAIGAYEAGKQGVGAIIDGVKPNARRSHRSTVPRASTSTQSRVMGNIGGVHSLYG